jgi:hypothetical protein
MKDIEVKIPELVEKRDEKNHLIQGADGSPLKEMVDVKHIITLKKLTFGEKNQLEEEATNVQTTGGVPIVKVSMSKLKEIGLLKAIVKSTYPLKTIDDIRNLPAEVGNKLFEEFTLLNNVSPS